ncbi:hypothetical protein H257_11654 [Aphanomyces astaci]|uniref:Uncharacterized protein n=1 Tax=Aphanomyces astaci TaxID=112090 RepID=W4G3A6_APHAT|nr:hypothetical protein H257_11654 [Aphanomyces astaci]ETV73529.1 hypothetical protein H257_11654 [Aphanomyces astaci]|eukprot:XP_009836955.1 hypothetical protein H257_11654 [Aphanomyces astaci]
MNRRTVVYLDESFIHHYYNKSDISLYDLSDELEIQSKPKHKGRRFCFIAAIVDGGPSNSVVLAYEKFVHGKQTKDYHGMFDHQYFAAWFDRLLDALDVAGITKTIDVMGNAKYHKSVPDDTPRFSWRKADLLDVCVALGIEHNPGDLKVRLDAAFEAVTSAMEFGCIKMS